MWIVITTALLLTFISGCTGIIENNQVTMAAEPSPTSVSNDPMENSGTQTPAPTITKSAPSITFSKAVPEDLVNLVSQTVGAVLNQNGDYLLTATEAGIEAGLKAEWIYALVAPFPTVADNLSLQNLQTLWKSGPSQEIPFGTVYLTEDTLAGFQVLWGRPNEEIIRIANSEELLDHAWSQKNSLAIIPFESISPRCKVLKIDGMSPLDPSLNTHEYPLKIDFEWQARAGVDITILLPPPPLPDTNRDPEKLTTVILTGTTALVREIAAKMEEKGVNYPAGDIAEVLKSADITHISNEVSFYQQCPPAVPVRKEMRFCSDPKYIELFDTVGADVIESTGNHLVDWGIEQFVYTLGLYKAHGFKYYGGGLNLEEARQALIMEHNGTLLAFIGCNISGPENDWATIQTAGAAPCDLEWMAAEVKQLRADGILPIVTFQHYEVDDYQPMNLTRQHFKLMADAGAVIVSGSQAHFPHGFAFSGDTFLHYGLGNLFFDQMFEGNRREFIDRHVFYNGRYLGVELLTAILEDYSRPRIMTTEERTQMLTAYFQASGW